MAAAVIVMCIIVFQSMQQNAHTQGMLVTMLNKTQNELLQSQREANAQFAERLAALAAQAPKQADAAPSEWNSLKIKCVLDTTDGPPAVGVKVDFSGVSERERAVPGDEQTTDATGMIDFGKVLYGHYQLSCKMPNGMFTHLPTSVRPGQDKLVTIVCPAAPPPARWVQFEITPPEELRSLPLHYIAVPSQATQTIENVGWNVAWSAMNVPAYVLGPDGALLGELDAELSTDLRKALPPGGSGTELRPGPLTDRLKHAQLSSVTERPGYQLSGTLITLIAEPDQTATVAQGQLPAVTVLTNGQSGDDRFFTNSTTGVIIQSPREREGFWRRVHETAERHQAAKARESAPADMNG
jgi:hypothetical protein